MVSPAAVVRTATAPAVTSLDFLYFHVYFGRAVKFDIGPVAFGAGIVAVLGPFVGAMK